MQYKFTKQEDAFREELRTFLKEELPRKWRYGLIETADEDSDLARRMRRKLADRGWLTLGWPKEYGGRGASPITQLVFNEEMAYHRSPGKDAFGIGMLGPALMMHGTEEQKRKYLPAIAEGRINWCQGFSEPGSGSDLASLQTRAVEDGDDYVISGQKIWTSGAHHADRFFMLARTDPDAPKHRGITFFMGDMKDPGVEVRPIVSATGRHSFNEVFFDNVRVNKRDIVGEVNRGWYVAMTLLGFERSTVEWPAAARRALEELVDYARETRRSTAPGSSITPSSAASSPTPPSTSRSPACSATGSRGSPPMATPPTPRAPSPRSTARPCSGGSAKRACRSWASPASCGPIPGTSPWKAA